jgi:hypothetical protein
LIFRTQESGLHIVDNYERKYHGGNHQPMVGVGQGKMSLGHEHKAGIKINRKLDNMGIYAQ